MTAPASAPAVALPAMPVWRQYYVLTKPRVVQLIVFCALIGMVLAVPGLPTAAALGNAWRSPAPASGWWRRRQRPSTAWSKITSTRA
jgi:hypothetical protein